MKYNLGYDKNWCILESEFSKMYNKHYEGLFTQGNGYISLRASFEEGLKDAPQDEEYVRMPANVTLEKPRQPLSKFGTYIPGIVGNHPLLKEEIINLPNPLRMNITIDNQELDMVDCSISKYKRWLDLRNGVVCRELIWKLADGSRIEINFTRYANIANKHIVAQSIKIKTLDKDCSIALTNVLNANVRTNGHNHFVKADYKVEENDILTLDLHTDNKNRVSYASSMKINSLCKFKNYADDRESKSSNQFELKAGEEVYVDKVTSIYTDRDGIEDYKKEHLSNIAIWAENQEHLFEEHCSKWNDMWQKNDIEIDGSDNSQLGIRAAIYHMIRSNARDDDRVSICAKGYAGEAYFGRSFWDVDIKMLPFYILTDPKAAKNLIMFRYNTLSGAKKNAQNYGYIGARYPWESSIDGIENCPNWQYADNEIHITADVVYAMINYYNLTGDIDFIIDYGLEVMIETARYWLDRVDYTKKGCGLYGVMGPDEYLPFTNNNYFTNKMVKYSLMKTVEILELVKKNYAFGYKKLIKKVRFTENEIDKFSKVARELPLPYDEEKKLVLQCDDYYDYPDIDFDKVWPNRNVAFGNCVSQERMYRTKCLKQADVLECMMLFPNDFTIEEMRNAYEYYEPITTHDSSLSATTHAIIALWTDKNNDGNRFLSEALNIDMDEERKGAAEGIHIANCGGIWQSIVYGIAGIKFCDNEVSIAPNMPSGWNSLKFKISYRGNWYKVEISKTDSSVTRI